MTHVTFSQIDTTEYFDTAAYTSGGNDTVLRIAYCDVWAEDIVEVKFSGNVVIDDVFKNVASYKIFDEDENELVPLSLIITDKDTKTDNVFLEIYGTTVGKTYRVVLDPRIVSDNNRYLGPKNNSSSFVFRKTKIDAILSTIPKIFDKSLDEPLRLIFNVIGRTDDLIGGNKNIE